MYASRQQLERIREWIKEECLRNSADMANIAAQARLQRQYAKVFAGDSEHERLLAVERVMLGFAASDAKASSLALDSYVSGVLNPRLRAAGLREVP